MARRIEVEIVGDSRSLERAFDRSAKSAQRFDAQITGIGTSFKRAFAGTAAALVAGGGIGAVAKALENAVSAASDLAEQTSKTSVVFGQSASGIVDWSKTTAAAMGLSERQALQTASSFGAMFAPLGIVGDQAAQQSERLTQLGADLASFYNTDVQSALDAIRSGLVGESEPLRRYGVLLSESRVQAEAMAESGKKSASALTDQEKVTARITLIMRDAEQASGDFARTSEGLANQQRILSAQIDDLKTGLGEALLPAITDVVTKFNEWLGDPENKQKVIDGFTSAINDLAGAAIAAGNAIQYMSDKRNAIKNWGGKGPSGLDIAGWIGRNFEGPPLSAFGGASLNVPGAPVTGGTGPTRETTPGAAAARARAEQTRLFDPAKAAGGFIDMAAFVNHWVAVGTIAKANSALGDIAKFVNKWADVGRKAAAAQKAAAAYQTRMETMRGWLDFGIERAQATKKLSDDRAAYRALERYLQERIRHEGRTLELVRDLWRARQAIRDLNKKQVDKDPLAGLMQVSTKQLTNILAAGTGLGAAGRGRLAYNIAGAEPLVVHNHVYIDGRQVAAAVTTHQTRAGRRTAGQTSGRRG